MPRRSATVLLALACGLAALAAVSVAGCGSGDGGTSSVSKPPPKRQAEPQAGASQAPRPTVHVGRAKAAGGVEAGQAGGPAAGVCAAQAGPVVTVQLRPDVPAPRCVVLHPSQRLRLVDKTIPAPSAKRRGLRVDFAGFHVRLVAGQAAILDAPAGSYLGNGVHEVAVTGAPSPQVWVK